MKIWLSPNWTNWYETKFVSFVTTKHELIERIIHKHFVYFRSIRWYFYVPPNWTSDFEGKFVSIDAAELLLIERIMYKYFVYFVRFGDIPMCHLIERINTNKIRFNRNGWTSTNWTNYTQALRLLSFDSVIFLCVT